MLRRAPWTSRRDSWSWEAARPLHNDEPRRHWPSPLAPRRLQNSAPRFGPTRGTAETARRECTLAAYSRPALVGERAAIPTNHHSDLMGKHIKTIKNSFIGTVHSSSNPRNSTNEPDLYKGIFCKLFLYRVHGQFLDRAHGKFLYRGPQKIPLSGFCENSFIGVHKQIH